MLLQLLVLLLYALLLAARFVSQRSRCGVWVQPAAVTKHLQPSTQMQAVGLSAAKNQVHNTQLVRM
jgi:hypothetical protein